MNVMKCVHGIWEDQCESCRPEEGYADVIADPLEDLDEIDEE